MLTLNLVYFSLVVVMTGFATFVYVWISTGQKITPVDAEFESLLRIITIATVPAGMGISYVAFKTVIKGIPPEMPLATKLHRYQSAVIVRGAGFEIPGTFAAVASFITGNVSFLLFTAVIVVLFLLFRPTIAAITNDLQLTATERSNLENNQPFTR
ncbi:MAG TPA: hypothetical protein PLM56_09465 [Cyclobacteriaceae bacterium]|nr:hypothetical protein [Cyclobacteriaceae bacterium]HRF33717.1 hypothetical protein [Cyclobacteriaceae bacterium]